MCANNLDAQPDKKSTVHGHLRKPEEICYYLAIKKIAVGPDASLDIHVVCKSSTLRGQNRVKSIVSTESVWCIQFR